MSFLPFILGLAGGLLGGSLPVAIHTMLIIPAWYLAHDRVQEALLCAFVGGLAAEIFSPWRFGMLTIATLASVLITQVIITRVLSVSGTLRLVVSLLLLTTIFSLPASLVAEGYRLLPMSILLTTAVGFVLLGLYDVRRRRLYR